MHYLLTDTDSKHRSAVTAEIIHFYIFNWHVTVSCFIHWWQWVHWHSIQTEIYYHFVRKIELFNISWDTHLNLQSFSSESVFCAWEVEYDSKLLTTWYSQCAKQYSELCHAEKTMMNIHRWYNVLSCMERYSQENSEALNSTRQDSDCDRNH